MRKRIYQSDRLKALFTKHGVIYSIFPPLNRIFVPLFQNHNIQMKISLNWLKEYVKLDLPVDTVTEALTEIGLEVEGVEEVPALPGGLKGLVVGEVLSAEKHENADKLSVTTVKVDEETFQIVCGAPNVAAGQKVIVALPGATIYPVSGEPFTIKKAKIRGVESNGMICAEDEIGLGNSHDGIMVLPQETPTGLPAADYFNLETDYIIEIGLTPNRSDANSHIGTARDLAAYLRYNKILETKVELPLSDPAIDSKEKISVEIKNTDGCTRYATLLIKNVQVGESPDWLKKRLNSIGMRSVNSVVDVTNFVLFEMGQPMHSFDYSKVKGGGIVVDTLPKGTKFTLLDGKEIELRDSDLVICNTAGEAMCLAGVYGGKESGVTLETKDVLLESAHFASGWIRRTSLAHNLRTDSARTYEKGTDPGSCLVALKRAADLIVSINGGEIASQITDQCPTPIQPAQVDINLDKINDLLGIKLDEKEYLRLFEALEFEVKANNNPGLTLSIPTYKTDVLREADVAEEVLRIYGLNKVELPQFMHIPNVTPDLKSDLNMKNKASQLLRGAGFLEAMSLSFSQSKYTKDLGFPTEDRLVFVNNTSNTHLDLMRPTLLFSMMENIQYNQNRQQKGAQLFEFGRSYLKNGEDYTENQELILVFWGKKGMDHWKKENTGKYDFYDLKAHVNNILNAFSIKNTRVAEISNEEFEYGTQILAGAFSIVEMGLVNSKVSKYFDIKDQVFIGKINWDNLLKAYEKAELKIEEPSKFPIVTRDFALVINEDVKFEEIEKIALKSSKPYGVECRLFDIYRDPENLGKDKKSYAISVVFEDKTKTLAEKQIEAITQKIMADLAAKLDAVIRN